MIDKKNIEIKMNGKQYLEYVKYKDKKRKDFWTKENKVMALIGGAIIATSLTIIAIVDMLTYTPPSGFNISWEGILMFLVIAIGLGWIIHGVGFLLVRR